ncbi:probable tubulin polyglutamylase ttll-15 isoform X2 [Neocloeon triangulifer]|uniref:probable tubulin polyglutamylase ttll-15 isoform X2 n=1 Tax=Neocloeon triangulifer TaxID=2078957 RepID=UPI00286F43D7|nr:probable tubulin polyglutamylase ttll-15 isoform X2 [Neocloeon triangulifer]
MKRSKSTSERLKTDKCWEDQNGIIKKKLKSAKNTSTRRGSVFYFLGILLVAFGGLAYFYSRLSNKTAIIRTTKTETINYKTPPREKPTVLLWCPGVPLIHMRHVILVFQRLGYKVTTDVGVEWDVLWAHRYPFDELVKKLKPNQRVNKFPSSGFVTQKVELATSGGLGIPPAFRLPDDKQKFLIYAKENPEAQFLEKDLHHRSVRLKPLSEINLDSTNSFVQKFISNPFLVDGRVFDIGVPVVLTSIDPLRIYKITGDIVFRFCKDPYENLNASNLNQYVIADDYIPSFDSPALKKYLQLSYSLEESFDAHLQSKGIDPKLIWEQIDDQIVSAYLTREAKFAYWSLQYGHKRSFFELVRFDFMLDSDLKVHLIEANMSPSLSSADHPPNGIRFEQVAFTTLSLVGLANYVHPPFQKLCAPCLAQNEELTFDLKMAYKEHMNKFRSVRIFPPRMTQEQAKLGIPYAYLNHRLTTKNMLLARWFQGKCLTDKSWC